MNRVLICAFAAIFISLASAGCRGYKDTSQPLSPKEIQITDLSVELVNQSEQLIKQCPPDLTQSLNEFHEVALRYNNSATRFGPTTLEARGAFDRLWYQTTQVDKSITGASSAEFYQGWQSIRDNYVRKIGRTLGYKMPE